MTFADLHLHTEYSVLDGMSTCAEAIARAVANGSPSAAITDHGHCMGHVHFQAEARKAGIHPVFGIETYFQPDRLIRPAEGDKDAQAALRNGRHLILLAQGTTGLHDLWAASTEAYVTGFYGKPRMDWALLEERGSDLIATTSCLGGMVSQDLLNGRYEQAFATLDRLKAVFPGRLYLELQANELPEQIRLNKMLALASAQFGIPLIAACDAHYPAETDAALHRLWMMCQSGKGKDDYWHFSAMLTENRIRELLGYLDPAVVDASIRNTLEVAARCTAEIGGHADPPVFTPGGTYADDARRLRELCEANWGRIRHPSRAHRDRMDFEFEVVADKNLAGCYLMVEDICRWVRGNGWLVGPGRGSAAGSLMSYLCDITSADPLEAGLMFERFLTPGRVSLPDFDLDFASARRTAIQDYAIRTYGAEHVVRVGTIMRYGAKGILNKLFSLLAGRLPAESEADASRIGGLIDEAEAGTAGLGLEWDELMEEREIAGFARKYQAVFEVAASLVGRVYAVGQHPAGLIIDPGVPLAGTMPMRIADTAKNKNLLVTQWDYRAADALGRFKLDFLTLGNLDATELCLDLVEKRTGQRLDLRNWTVELTDPQVYDDIGTGETLGIFQLGTSLCQDYCRRMKPPVRTIDDLADLTTYIRPGPRNSGATEQYLRRRAGLEPVDYPHPDLIPVLESTYGVMLYQEQILWVCRILAGYDDLEADGVRKILGKKLMDKIGAAGGEFVRRCTARGHDEEAMRELWSKMAEFGKYAFNKCITGDTRIHLAASSQNSHGDTDVASLYRRLHAPLLPAIRGRTKTGDEYRGPCVACGAADSPRQWVRGLCSTCYVWRQKFHDPKRGVHGLSYWADGRIRPARILDVVRQGVQETWKIVLKDGRSVTATGNHRHLTDAGYRRVDELLPGDCLIIDTGYEPSGYVPERHRLTRGDRKGEGKINGASGEENYGFIDGGGAFWKQWRQTHPKVCIQCGAEDGRIELAHLDGDHANNVEGNLAWLCASCHKAYDYAHNDRPRRWEKGHRPEAVPIESIERAGFQETYDVVMDSPHNFVANGIVTHNSHGYSYAVLSYWTAWLKTHYPVEFAAAVLSVQDEKEKMAGYATEARRLGITVLPPDVSISGADFAVGPLSVRYGLSAIPKVGPAAVAQITARQPYASLEDFRKRSGANAGVMYALARAGALDGLVPTRRGLITLIEADRDGSAVRCIHKLVGAEAADPLAAGPNGLPCTYDWANEPQPTPRISEKTGRTLKVHVKPPPARCTIVCRQYTPPHALDLAAFSEYDAAETFRSDLEIYGTWMNPAAFDRLESLGEGMRERARQVALMLRGAPEGMYPLAAVYAGKRTATTKAGSAMWWVQLATEVSALSIACFSPRSEHDLDVPAMLRSLRQGDLVAAEVIKRSYQVPGRGTRMGWRLNSIRAVG